MRDQGLRGHDHSATEDWPVLEQVRRFEERWRAGDRPSIEGVLAETEASRLEELLTHMVSTEVRLRRESGDRPSPDEYLGRFPDHAPSVTAAFEDRSLSASLSTEESRPVDGEALTKPVQEPTDHASMESRRARTSGSSKEGCRYRILSHHASGGLGDLYVAEDLEFGRKVALKEIQERHARNAQSRARFLLEAEVTGKLEHPSIVPVYGQGHYRDGRPYYAMRFIKGDSFREAIDRFHLDGPERPRGEQELMFRGLLGRFVDVCNAIEYAHSRGVLHRDLKPGNVMLGRFGETLVVDWGLAKLLGSDREIDATDGPIQARAGEGLDSTRVNLALGTPRYMSPEQAAGRVDQVGPASDIYSLGATLHCLLTGRPPAADSHREGEKNRGELLPPKKVHRKVPPPLESICLRAMAIEPDRRYPTPRAMADDVERWLADEPVSAHRDPLTIKAARWVRRHRTMVAAAAALLITLSIVLALSNLAIRAEERKAEQARTEAEGNFKLALEAVDQMLDRVSDQRLIYVPQMTDLRSDLGDDAARFHKKLLGQQPGNANLLWKYAHLCIHAANNHMVAGRLDRFLQYYDEIFATYGILLANRPGNLFYINALAYAKIEKGFALQQTGRIKPALAIFRDALRDADRITREKPESDDFRFTMARARMCLADALVLIGEIGEARDLYDAAIAPMIPAVEARPQDHPARRQLIQLFCGRGVVAADSGDPVGAKRNFGLGLLQVQALKDQGESSDEVENLEAILLDEQGRWLASIPGSMAESERVHHRAAGLMKGLSDKYPGVPDYRLEQAVALLGRGLARVDLGAEKLREAEDDLRGAIDLIDPIVRKDPSLFRARSLLGQASGALGRRLLDRGDREHAVPLLNRAVELQKACLQENGTSPRDRKALGTHEASLRRAGLAP